MESEVANFVNNLDRILSDIPSPVSFTLTITSFSSSLPSFFLSMITNLPFTYALMEWEGVNCFIPCSKDIAIVFNLQLVM